MPGDSAEQKPGSAGRRSDRSLQPVRSRAYPDLGLLIANGHGGPGSRPLADERPVDRNPTSVRAASEAAEGETRCPEAHHSGR